MSPQFEKARVLIWGKTYPELSSHHKETVCTGGCLEDGRPVRLYPVPFRYLAGREKYRLYDWIEVAIARNPRDTRPESFKILPEQIRIVGHMGPTDRWSARRDVIFRNPDWHFGCVEELKAAQQSHRCSLGMVKVGAVDEVELEVRSVEDGEEHRTKLAALQGTPDLFGVEMKDLEFIPFRVRLRWRCAGGTSCPGHSASVLDWGLLELGRREGGEKAFRKLKAIANLDRHDLHLYMGNFFTRPQTFGCIGLWYPLRTDSRGQEELELG